MSAQIPDEKIVQDLQSAYAYLCSKMARDGQWHDLSTQWSTKRLIKTRLGCKDGYASMILKVFVEVGLVSAGHHRKILAVQTIDTQTCLKVVFRLRAEAKERHDRSRGKGK